MFSLPSHSSPLRDYCTGDLYAKAEECAGRWESWLYVEPKARATTQMTSQARAVDESTRPTLPWCELYHHDPASLVCSGLPRIPISIFFTISFCVSSYSRAVETHGSSSTVRDEGDMQNEVHVCRAQNGAQISNACQRTHMKSWAFNRSIRECPVDRHPCRGQHRYTGR